ncbi:MAG: prepilin-type N-terminal cleavage/methylation domain-containing protein [Acidimicrobiia bacterium]
MTGPYRRQELEFRAPIADAHPVPGRRSEDGFTLIELMVVVLVIAVLVGAAVPTMLGARTRGQDGAAKSNLRASLEVAVSYATANAGTWPTSTAMAAFSGQRLPRRSRRRRPVQCPAGLRLQPPR